MNIKAELQARKIQYTADQEEMINVAENLERQFSYTIRNMTDEQKLHLTCIYFRWIYMGFTEKTERDTILTFLRMTKVKK